MAISAQKSDFQADMVDFVSDADELGCTISVGLITIAALPRSEYLAAQFEHFDVASHDSYFYAAQSDLDAASAAIGTRVFMFDQAYSINGFESNGDSTVTMVTLEKV